MESIGTESGRHHREHSFATASIFRLGFSGARGTDKTTLMNRIGGEHFAEMLSVEELSSTTAVVILGVIILGGLSWHMLILLHLDEFLSSVNVAIEDLTESRCRRMSSIPPSLVA